MFLDVRFTTWKYVYVQFCCTSDVRLGVSQTENSIIIFAHIFGTQFINNIGLRHDIG